MPAPDDMDPLDVIDHFAKSWLDSDPGDACLRIIRHLVEALASDTTQREQCVKEAAELAMSSDRGWQPYWDEDDETW